MAKFSVGDRCRGINYDPKFHDVLRLFSWRISVQGTNKYAKASLPRLLGGKSVLMHHMILYWLLGHRRQPGREIDHKDGNGLNNLVSNLRFASSAENRRNKKKTRGTSRFKGVYRLKERGELKNKWVAQIVLNKKKAHLGRYESEVDAAIAYNKAAKRLHGKFARLNEV